MQGGMWCVRCNKPVMGVRTIWTLRLDTESDYACPTCGGPVRNKALMDQQLAKAAKQAAKAKEIETGAWWLEDKVFKGLWSNISPTRYLGGWTQHQNQSSSKGAKILQLDQGGVHLKFAFKTKFTITWTEVENIDVEDVNTNNRPLVQDFLTSQTKKPDKQAVVVFCLHSGEDVLFLVERLTSEELYSKLSRVITHMRSAKERGLMNSNDETSPSVSIAAKEVQNLSIGLADELAKLASLRDSGILSDEEFAAAKARLLGT